MFKKIFTRQWSFFWSGVGFGVAQIIFMIAKLIDQSQAGKPLFAQPIGVTTYLGNMFRSMEVFWWGGKTFGLENGLYGSVFKVGTWGPIVGMILGGFLVALAERESRGWAKFSPKMLLTSFAGGILFSYGTRLAGGCTLHHLLGGISMMSVKSTFVVVMMSIGGLTAFFLMAKAGLAPFFKHQETRSYVEGIKAKNPVDGITFDPKYNPWRDPWRWAGLIFLAMFLIPALVNYFSPNAADNFVNASMVFTVLVLVAGLVAGFSMAKSGFGTECALVGIEAGIMLKKDEPKFIGFKVPAITRTLMKGFIPIQGVLAAQILTALFALGAWILLGAKPGYQYSSMDKLSWAGLLGGLLLGAGAVMLIGCEIRSYMRLGLGYTNTLVGFIGFAIGYLPYTLFPEAHKAFLESSVIIKSDTFTWGQVFFPNNPSLQIAFYVVWILALVGALALAIRTGARYLSVKPAQLTNQPLEDLEAQVREGVAEPSVKGLEVQGVAAAD